MSRIRLLAVVLTLSSVALVGQQAPPGAQGAPPPRPDPQMPPITFRSEVNYVEVDAVVRDAQGKFVRDLRLDEFQVLEDGVPQVVKAFSIIDIPIELSERALFLPQDIDPDVRSNAAGTDGRLYVLLLDDIHTDAMRSIHVRRAAKQFIEKNLGANDLTAVVYTSGRTDGTQDFTNSRRLLTQAVDKFMGRKLRSATLNKIDNYNMTRGGTQPGYLTDPDEQQRLYNARVMLSTLTNLSEWLSGVRGRRKAVVLIGEGIDFNIWDSMGPTAGAEMSAANANHRSDGTMLLSDTREVIGAATRANVNIYAIDPRGLYAYGDEAVQVSSLPMDAQTVGIGVTSLQDELRASQDSLRALSEETGGFASLSSNDFTNAFRRIVEENSSYYVLGYYSTNDKRDGRFRRIDVRLTRPGLDVNARRGYEAPRGKPKAEKKLEASNKTSKELRETLNSPLQVSDLKMAVFAAPLKGPSEKAAVVVVTQFLGSDLAFVEKAGKFTNALEMAYMAVDKNGKVAAGSRDLVEMSLKPETMQRVQQAGFRVQARLELPPGTYQFRVGAREGGGRTGSVHYDLIVPDFAKEPLVISGLLLTSKAAGGIPTAGRLPDIGNALPAPPTSARVFTAADELAVLGEVYDNQVAAAHSVDITCTLKAEGRVEVFTNAERRSSKELGGARGGFGYTARIPLKDLKPGLYVLKLEAKSSLSGAGTATREVQIRIVP